MLLLMKSVHPSIYKIVKNLKFKYIQINFLFQALNKFPKYC